MRFPTLTARRTIHRFAAAAVLAGVLGTAVAQDGDGRGLDEFVRVVENNAQGGERVSLQVASVEYRRRDADGEFVGPRVWLVGAVHIGTAAYYREIQRELDTADLVLYEGVGRPEFIAMPQQTDAQRRERTEAAFATLQSLAPAVLAAAGPLPESSEVFIARAAEVQSIVANQARHALIDAWGRPVRYRTTDEGTIRLTSLGADGELGGEGAAADIVLEIEAAGGAQSQANGLRDLQGLMASTLGLVFQLDHIDYNRQSFLASDMSEAQLEEAMRARGLGGQEITGLVGLDSQMVGALRMLAGLIRMVPDGQLIGRLVLVDTLGSGDAAMAQLDERLAKVIIDDRNGVVIDDLRRVLGALREVADDPTVSVFYGVGHFPDFETRFDQDLGLEPTGEVRWHTAISADISQASNPGAVRTMRQQFRASMDQAMQAGGGAAGPGSAREAMRERMLREARRRIERRNRQQNKQR